jgi:hypothetical protein
MPALRKRIVKYTLASIAVVFSLLFISVFLFSKFYFAKKVQSLVVNISKEKGYEVRIGDITFGFLTGLEIEKIEIFDSRDINAYPITIGELIIKPGMTSSIIERKLVIEEIVINDVGLSLPQAGLDKLKKLSSEIRQKRLGEEEERFLPIAIKRIELNKAQIEVSEGVKLYLSKLDCRLRDYELQDQRNIELKGTVIFLDNEIRTNGLIKASSNETTGELSVNISDFKSGFLPKAPEDGEKLSLDADLNFRIADTISSTGRIVLANGDGITDTRSLLSTEFQYDITYDKISDRLLINAFDFDVGKLVNAKFDGSIDRITTDGVFNIAGSASTTRVEDVITSFHRLSHVVASGEIEARDLTLTGSLKNNDVSFGGKAILSGVDFDDRQRDIRVNQLGGTLIIKNIISRSVSSGLSIQGRLNSKNVVTKIGLLEGLDGEFDFKTNGTWNSSELSFSLKNLKLERGLNDTLKISNLKTREPINMSFDNTSEKSLSESHMLFSREKISLISRGLTFKDASYKGFEIEMGSIDDISALYESDGNLSVEFTVNGSKITGIDDGIYLDRIRVDLVSDENRGFGFKGNVNLKDGRYGGFKFPSITSDYAFERDGVKLINLEASLDGSGALKADEAMIIFGGEGDRFSDKIRFSRGSFSSPKFGVESTGIGGEFISQNGGNKKKGWGGEIFADEVNVRSQTIKQISVKLDSSSYGIRVYDLKGSVFGGRLSGSLSINTTKPLSSVSSSLTMKDADIPYGSNVFFLESMVLDFNGTLDKGLTPQGLGDLRIENLRIMDNGRASSISSRLKFQLIGETLLLKTGFIENGDGQKIEFTGRMEDLLNEQRVLKIKSNRIPLSVVMNILSPYMPESVKGSELRGDVMLDMVFDHVAQKNLSWSGKLSVANTSFSGDIALVPTSVSGINGVVTFDEYSESGNILTSLLREHRKLDKEVFKRFLSLLKDAHNYGKNDFFRIDELKYGFLNLDDIECLFNITGLRLNLNQCASNLFGGRIYIAGSFDFSGEKDRYDLSVLFKDISLEDISNRVKSIKDYITGRMNGLVWLNGKGEELKTIDGLFEFWSLKSKKEPRRLGKAFLEKLGAKSRFFVGSSRRYDMGEISGYIKDGVLTFSDFDISNTILGYKNLSISVDPRRNTISLAHMLSVIRGISKRASEGQLQIDLEKKRN